MKKNETTFEYRDGLNAPLRNSERRLFDPELEHSSCGVGFLTAKTGVQSHEVVELGHQALCEVPHRGGMSSEGVGDGAGVNIDLSEAFFSKLLGRTVKRGQFGVANFFFPQDESREAITKSIIERRLAEAQLPVLLWRGVPVNLDAINEASAKCQRPLKQLIFGFPEDLRNASHPLALERRINDTMVAIEEIAYSDPELEGFYPCSMSSRTVVYKGRLNSNELVPYFQDLTDPDQKISIFMFHTRFSTNTDPASHMAQPFCRIAHNGELNTDKKNRLSEAAIARLQDRNLVCPKGQSDSARLDQTVTRRIVQDHMDIVEVALAMMPPAWENDGTLAAEVRDMLEFFSLSEEKVDGPAALIFSDGVKVGARLDRLGLRPLRSVETDEYVAVTSEAGQIVFPAEKVIRRGRIEAGGMLYYDHSQKRVFNNEEALAELAQRDDYPKLLAERRILLKDLPPAPALPPETQSEWGVAQRYVAYSLNQESFKFLLDPTIQAGAEKVSAMGYDLAINAITNSEGGMAKYFSQRFAQVTNPPLDSIRELDGMTLRVSLGSKPLFTQGPSRQIVLDSPILFDTELDAIRDQKEATVATVEMFYQAQTDRETNEAALLTAVEALREQVVDAVRAGASIVILTDRRVGAGRCPIPALLAIAATNQALIESGLRFNASLVAETGQAVSSHEIATLLGFGAHAVSPISASERVKEVAGDDQWVTGFKRFRKGAEKALLKTMGKFGLCTVESYIGGEFFEGNFFDSKDPRLAQYFPNIDSPLGGAGYSEIAAAAADWYFKAEKAHDEKDVPLLGLFKERQDGAGHSYGTVAVREYTRMTEELITFATEDALREILGSESVDAPDALIAALVELSEDTDLELKNGAVGAAVDALFDRYGCGVRPEARKAITALLNDRRWHLDADESDERHDDLHQAFEAYFASQEAPYNFVYKTFGNTKRTPEQINRFRITPAYARFVENLEAARRARPSALRDILDFPVDLDGAESAAEFEAALSQQSRSGSPYFSIVGIDLQGGEGEPWRLSLNSKDPSRLPALVEALGGMFPGTSWKVDAATAVLETSTQDMIDYLSRVRPARSAVDLGDVEPADHITPTLSSAAMSHGALTGVVHEAVSQGANIAGALSNSGEGGERAVRFNTVKASSIKQIASGRFGVWAGYFADPALKEVEIKIAQGAKPGEGGQLPSRKVTVEIAASRGGTPGIELVSPPPHHDTYSIEDLSQLIHDAKASRAKVIVKLVSSEGIGTIAVGVAKAGADVINVAGATGGTGAAQVTSLKNTGRASEIGIAEVHKALCLNGIRQKVVLRTSAAHQTGADVVKSAILGADSFEFGTTALMMLKCVMAKNCNVKCPAGLTTNPEVYQGDARALAQFFMNVAHDVRRILARLGYTSLEEIRGETHLLHLVNHPELLGSLDCKPLLEETAIKVVDNPIYREADYRYDEAMLPEVEKRILRGTETEIEFEFTLTNRNKSFAGRLAIDIERSLNHQLDTVAPAVLTGKKGRRFLRPETVRIRTKESAGQSFGAWLNEGLHLEHSGVCNDGVGKGMCGGLIVVKSPGGGSYVRGENVLIGNFALFGASGGQLFVSGEAGDRCAVRNSGALAVVEGVGDFCCEYMTSGVLLNLGGFGKGFCNGMSGGAAYQYDPEDRLRLKYSAESVLLKSVSDESPEAAVHERILKYLLNEHLRRTGSPLAQRILDRWKYERKSFKYCVPIALYATQTASGIAESMERGAIVAELSLDAARRGVSGLAEAYQTGTPFAAGYTPGLGEIDSDVSFQLLNGYAYLAKAVEMARDQLKKAGIEVDNARVDARAKEIIMRMEPKLIDSMAQEARLAFERFETEPLASKLAAKRIRDYKSALIDRDIQETHTVTASAWILEQQAANADASAHESTFLEWQAEGFVEKIIA